MSEPTTEDTGRPAAPDLPAMPALADVPRDSAVETEALAAMMLDDVRKWAPLAVAAMDYEGAARLRRLVSPIASAIYRRGLSKTATLNAQHAARITDRVTGLTILAGQDAGRVRRQRHAFTPGMVSPRDLVGTDTDRVYRLASVDDATFDAAVERARDQGSVGFETVSGALGVEGLTEIQAAQRDRLVTLATDGRTTRQIAAAMEMSPQRISELAKRYAVEIPADATVRKSRKLDPVRIIETAIPTIDGVGTAARELDPEDFEGLDPAWAKDRAAQLWQALVPVMHLQRSLRDRGKKA